MIKLDFTGKSAIITGGGSGIAKAIALQFAEAGANVWIGEIVEKNAQQTVDEMNKYGNSYGFSKVDVGLKEDVQKMFDDAQKQFGTIDIVINGAGVFCDKHFTEATPEQIKRHLDINLMGVVYGCQIGLDIMIKQGKGGKIVNVSSVGGRHGEKDFPYYALGKAGILNLTQSVAYNAAPHGVTCNALCPGIIRTPMWKTILKGITGGAEDVDYDQLFNDVLMSRTPMGRAQTPDEMAYTVLFLSSQYADVITGQAWNVCGGAVMS